MAACSALAGTKVVLIENRETHALDRSRLKRHIARNQSKVPNIASGAYGTGVPISASTKTLFRKQNPIGRRTETYRRPATRKRERLFQYICHPEGSLVCSNIFSVAECSAQAG
jgi:hypothetical protein